jgi:hypothetical protein
MRSKGEIKHIPTAVTKAARLYADLMEEIKRRTSIISGVLDGSYRPEALRNHDEFKGYYTKPTASGSPAAN